MNERLLSSFDELSSLVIMAEYDDEEATSEIKNYLVETGDQIKSSLKNKSFLELYDSCCDLLEIACDKNSSDQALAWNQFCEKIEALQKDARILLNSPDLPDDGTTTTDKSEVEFSLPDWVDSSVFDDFLAASPHVLEEIESDTLSLEGGDKKVMDSIRRTLHTLKGEAGVLGLEDLESVCHAVEDFMGSPRSIQEIIDQLLQIKDWIAISLDCYARSLFPSPRAKIVIEQLSNGSFSFGATSGPPKTEVAPKPKPSIQEDTSDVSSSEDESTPDSSLEASSAETAEAAAKDDETTEPQNEEHDWDDETVELVGEFLEETDDGLGQNDQILMSIETEGGNPESINALFRTFHTIKGVAGFLEFDEIQKLSHTTETLLNQVREGKRTLEGTALDLIFDSTEMMRLMVDNVRQAVLDRIPIASVPALPKLLSKLEILIDGNEIPPESLPEANEGEKLGLILSRIPLSIAPAVITDALESQKLSGRPLGEELVSKGDAKPKQVAQAIRAQNTSSSANKGKTKIKETVKIDLNRVDSLVEMIGELVIVESMVVNAPEIAELTSHRVSNYLGQLGKITHDLQDVGMRMRMVPVRGVFQKMSRMVRDLSRKSKKTIKMDVSGEATEMDRSMVEQISDPLVHMIRNSVDHGVESSADRVAAGKPETGTVSLAAYHEGGSIVIQISDDGKGLDREVILAKAIKQNLIDSDPSTMTDSEVFNLIFAPGFSTAQKVTEISGRGVGMDVVRRNIEAMRGRITITSKLGEGTSFKMILPLTLAIIDGMLVSCGEEQYIIPTLSIVESIKPTPEMAHVYADDNELINIRGEILPLFRLNRLFEVEGAKQELSTGLVVVIEGTGFKSGLLVDDVLTQQQVVIKKMGSGLQDSTFVAGAAIMSDGNVGLILNTDEIGSHAGEILAKSDSKKTSEKVMSNMVPNTKHVAQAAHTS